MIEGTTAPADADQVNVWIADAAGNKIRLTPYTDPTCVSPPCSTEQHSPRLSPDGTLVAFHDFDPDDNAMSLYVVPVDGSATYPLASGFRPWDDGGDGSWALHPCWKPDGSAIVFTYAGPDGGSYVGGTFGGRIIEVTYPGGTPTTLWTPAIQSPQREEGYRPTYSPDGTKIAFLVNIALGGGGTLANQGLWVMDAYGSNVTQLDNWDSTNADAAYLKSGTQIAWSNDSQWIAYVDRGFTGGAGTFSVWKIMADGTNKTLLVDGSSGTVPHHIGWGAWLDDDSKVIYTENGGGGSGDWSIKTVDADGTNETEIVSSANGPNGTQNFETCYRLRDRIYWPFKKTPNATDMRSCALDGTDIVSYFTLTDTVISNGTGFEWL
jgi:Tol biopolymer transport system component